MAYHQEDPQEFRGDPVLERTDWAQSQIKGSDEVLERSRKAFSHKHGMYCQRDGTEDKANTRIEVAAEDIGRKELSCGCLD